MARNNTRPSNDTSWMCTRGHSRYAHRSDASTRQHIFSQSSLSPEQNQNSARLRSRRRKLVRAQQACTRCRKKKAKCNGSMPVCSRCVEYGADCVYDRVTASDRSLEDIDKLATEVMLLKSPIASLVDKSTKMYQLLTTYRPGQSFQMPMHFDLQEKPSLCNQQNPSNHSPKSNVAESKTDINLCSAKCVTGLSNPTPSNTYRRSGRTLSKERLFVKDNLSVHWLSMNTFLKGSETVHSVLQEERSRELLTSLSRTTPKQEDRYDPAIASSLHGRAVVIPAPRYGSQSSAMGYSHCRSGPSDVMRTPRDLFGSFLRNIHSLHPFLDVEHARKIVNAIADTEASSPAWSGVQISSPTSTATSCHSRAFITEKHQNVRNPTLSSGYPRKNYSFSIQENNWVHVLDEASILLVFALAMLSDSDFAAHQGEDPPGIECYTRAAGILGMLTGSSELQYVHSLLLAGLYVGLLARPLEAWRWVHSASVTMEVLFMQTPSAMDVNCCDPHLDAFRLSFWTCFELESNFASELGLSLSDIFHYSDRVPLPMETLEPRKNLDDLEAALPADVISYYREQIKLMRLLYRIRSCLALVDNAPDKQHYFHVICERRLREQLGYWKGHLPASLAWNDRDDLPNNPHSAFLQASYYRAYYLLHQPYLCWVVRGLPCNPSSDNTENSASASTVHERKCRTASDFISATKGLCTCQQTMVYAEYCLDAAIKSIDASNKVMSTRGKFTTTNIFGNLLAQSDALLLLASASRSPNVSHLVKREQLYNLLCRTLVLVDSYKTLSPTIQRKLEVLEELRAQLVKFD